MENTTLPLPIRLVPRKGQQMGMLLFFTVFFAIAVLWMAGVSGLFDLKANRFSWPGAGQRGGVAVALLALPFAAIGLGGMAVAVLKMRPGSPHYHIAIAARGIQIRELFKLRQFDWDKLPAFATIKVERRTRNGHSIAHYTVANELLADRRQREVLRIRADDYGARNGEEDAEALTAWFNALRDLALDGRLADGRDVAVPAPFQATALSPGAESAPTSAQPAGIIRQSGVEAPRRPTVDRQ